MALDTMCKDLVGGDLQVPEEEQLILDKYIEEGYIKYTRGKIGLQKEVYFPSLALEEFTGLSGDIWLRILRYTMSRNGIDSKIGRNSIKEYVGKPWEYDIDPMVVITGKAAGGNQIDEEDAAWKELMKRIEDEK